MVIKSLAVHRRPSILLLFAVIAAALIGSAALQAQLPSGPACTPGTNQPPVARDDVATAYQTVAANIKVLANDSDPNGNPLTIATVTQPNNGTVTINAGTSVTYKSTGTFTGEDTFTYVVKDSLGAMASASVAVTVKKLTLVLALGFNEASGATAIDSSPLANNGTIREAVRVVGQNGTGALAFDGINDWVTVPDQAQLRLTTGMTLEAWVKPAGNNGWTTVVQKERPAGLAYSLYARDGAPSSGLISSCSYPCTTKPAGYVRINFIDQPVRGAAELALNTWSHVAVTYGGGFETFYVNGVLVGTRAQTGSITTTADPVRIGGNLASGEFFKGLIDDVRIYNLPLSAAEIQADMLTPVQ